MYEPMPNAAVLYRAQKVIQTLKRRWCVCTDERKRKNTMGNEII